MLRLRMARPSQPDGSLAPNTFDVGARLADALAELREIEQLVKASSASTLAAPGIRAAIRALQRWHHTVGRDSHSRARAQHRRTCTAAPKREEADRCGGRSHHGHGANCL